MVNGGTIQVLDGAAISVVTAASGAGLLTIDDGTADFACVFRGRVAFGSLGGTLELAHSRFFTGQISGFSTTGSTILDLADIAFSKATASFSGTTTSGVLTVSDGTHTSKITLLGDYLGSTFTLAADATGGTKVTDPPASAPAPALTAAVAAFAPPAATLASLTPAHPRLDGPLLAMR